MTEKLSIDNKMLAYLFDPDEGLKQDVVNSLNALANDCAELEERVKNYKIGWAMHPSDHQARAVDSAEAQLEVAEAQLTFYTDVWEKIKHSTAKVDIQAQVVELTGDLDNIFTRHYPGFGPVAEILVGNGWRLSRK